MAVQKRARFTDILLAIQAQVASWLEWDVSRVLIVARPEDKVPHLMGDQDVVLRVRNEIAINNVIDAAGRYDNRRERRITVLMRVRYLVDVTGQDSQRLTDETNGLLTLEDDVLDALETFLVTDADSNILTACPIRVGALTDPSFGGTPNRHAGWISSSFDLSVPYERAVTQIPWPFEATGVT